MKATRKLIPALAMLLVAAVVMSSASYAWFTMSRQVTAQGMNVTVTAPNNLLIMATGTSDAFAEISTINGQNIILMPASSNSGEKNDIYVVKDGQPLDATNGSLFMGTNGKQTLLEGAKLAVGSDNIANAKAGGYYDFKYTIKTEGNSAVNVVVSQITVTKQNDPDDKLSVKPVRIAVMSVSGENEETMVKVYKPDSTAVNHDSKVVDSISGGVPTLVADNIYTAVATKNNDGNYVATLNSGNSYTQNIIIRVWYEGQDKDCVVSKGANVNFNIDVVLADVASLDAPVGP